MALAASNKEPPSAMVESLDTFIHSSLGYFLHGRADNRLCSMGGTAFCSVLFDGTSPQGVSCFGEIAENCVGICYEHTDCGCERQPARFDLSTRAKPTNFSRGHISAFEMRTGRVRPRAQHFDVIAGS